MARTMSDEQEREIRHRLSVDTLTGGREDRSGLLAELDAERAAHEDTRQTVTEYTHKITELSAELTSLKARLALAEAVCESSVLAGPDALVSRAALAAWRAGK